ncbi:hypothetical protein [Lacimicrobium alkaliphilum]|uniref:Prephenate dehydrogenase n=1 Tax=Lacimicrobium alkaliphilum TaxID=1526571 RepID=A0A0U3AM40_9ALTE|nr:hypothetical protein [Lacimicrobium alkaliphilum]ALS99841.1 hypothetical protein AT746_17270 [Lacimicrobium alkaliphilum]
MQPIIDKLKENMQLIYRRALDADNALARLQQSGKGKFKHVFADDAGFVVRSKRFSPYVEELGKQVVELESVQDKAEFETRLAPIVKKMELMLLTLANFQQSLKDK